MTKKTAKRKYGPGNLYTLTEEHRARFPEWRDRWIEVALRTRPQDAEDRRICTAAIDGLYQAAKLKPVPVIFVPSPIVGAMTWCFASMWWWLRANPARHTALFGRVVTEAEIRLGVEMAIGVASRAAHGLPRGQPVRGFATSDATSAATDAATDAATSAATDAATRAADPVCHLMLSTLVQWARGWNGGNHWAGWCAYLSFFRDVAKLDLPEYAAWSHWELAALHGSHRYMHERFCVVSDFPTAVHRNAQNQPHAEHGPAIGWSDGWGAWRWHGQVIPREWIEQKASIDPTLALTHPQIEMRRIVAEIVGWAAVLKGLKPRSVDKDGDPQVGELIEVDLPGVGRERFLRVVCGTGRLFALPVPPTMRTALEANAWSYGLTPEQYRPEVRT